MGDNANTGETWVWSVVDSWWLGLAEAEEGTLEVVQVQ